MSIATEITRLQKAKIDIKSAIEDKGVTVGDGTIDTYAEKISEISGGSNDYNQGFEDGKNSVVQLDRYLKNNPQFSSLNMFGTSNAVLNLDNATNLSSMFSISTKNNPNVNTTLEHITINCPNLVNACQMILYCDNYCVDYVLKKVTLNIDMSNSTRVNQMFHNLRALEMIDGTPLCYASSIDNSIDVGYCPSLTHFRVIANSIKKNFGVQYSPNLSTETIQSIIDGLADLTGGTAQTLTLHATVGGKLTDEQKATITAKNWELVY